MPELISRLEQYDISAERKSLYDDMEALRLFGYDICTVKSKNTGYFIGSRDFELPELKLLVDSVQASRFITKKKTMELISKLGKLASVHQGAHLTRQVYVTNRVKNPNEKIYYAVDKIYEAISRNKKVSFKYFEWTVTKGKRYRKDGMAYTETPVTLTWDDENYYMIAYKEKYNGYTHYRVDKMEDIQILEENRTLPEKDFDGAEYAKKVFGMFGGEEILVQVRFDNKYAGVIIDRFGEDVNMYQDDNEHFVARFRVAKSPQFYGWIMSLGTGAKILSPSDVRDEFIKMINETSNIYK